MCMKHWESYGTQGAGVHGKDSVCPPLCHCTPPANGIWTEIWSGKYYGCPFSSGIKLYHGGPFFILPSFSATGGIVPQDCLPGLLGQVSGNHQLWDRDLDWNTSSLHAFSLPNCLFEEHLFLFTPCRHFDYEIWYIKHCTEELREIRELLPRNRNKITAVRKEVRFNKTLLPTSPPSSIPVEVVIAWSGSETTSLLYILLTLQAV